jgi:hypothetical protein
MDKQYLIPVGIIILVVALIIGLFFMNGMLVPAPVPGSSQNGAENLSFRPETVTETKYVTFRYIPDHNSTGPVNVMYQVQKDSQTVINDKKIFESVTPENPIEISLARPVNGTYSMSMQISDRKGNPFHKSITVWNASNSTPGKS